ncbi:MAG: hypothetical protein LBP87_00675, partial [Planctomycetaceae bacterium]|nr:hypothetical protein [Planctomycetaceae bacterium]
PEDNWKANEVGIRRNGDYDDGNASRDWWSGTASAGEDDLIRLDIDIIPASGIEYRLKTTDSQPAVRLRNSKLKGGNPINTTGNGTIIALDKTIYAEYISSGNNHVTFELVAIISATGQEFYSEEITFRPFESVTDAFVGEHSTAGGNNSVSQWVRNQLLDGYDVHVFDDGHDWWQSDDCDEWGEGPALDEIANAINNRGVTQIALVGYSHGGGSVYNLSKRLYYDGQTTMWYGVNRTQEDKINNNKTYTVSFTSYIDAIENYQYTSGDPEIRKPLSSNYHLNQYQTNGLLYVGGSTIGGGIIINVNRTNQLPTLYHMTIIDDYTVLFLLTFEFQSQTIR